MWWGGTPTPPTNQGSPPFRNR
uniref:Uncharacterized protein n=1 Tax=Arundo donax TaxID=35708 RepID=A0A0A8YD61_ARUDO